MAKDTKQTEKATAPKSAVATPVEKVQENVINDAVAEQQKKGVDEVEVKAKAKVDAEAKAKVDAEAKAKVDAEAQAKVDAEAQAKVDAEAQAKVDAEAKAKVDAEAKLKALKYGFTADAPQSIRYNGEVHTQEEVLTNEDLLAELVQGKCIFIKRL